LLKKGVNKDKAYDKVYNSFSADRMRFMGHIMLNRMVVFPELKTAYIYITAKDRKDFNEKFGDTENFVNIPLGIKGIIFSAIFIERDNFVKISFRSKGSFDTNKFSATHFKGGGHINASGGESHDSLQETTKRFVSILQTYSDELKNYEY
ncbi:MAG TPA: DHHA1 domain-containing protein, partial [Bacteroidales bacterium]|nr:DHHA1 domain-containing protein [Bacteroidales bacterium]